MNRQWKFVITTALCAVGLRQAWAESPQVVTLDIEWQNWVVYIGNVADASQLASSPNAVTATLRNFMSQLGIADIVSVNGKPAKGNWVHSGRTVNMAPSPAAGQGVGDVVRSGIVDVHFEILQADGTPIGSIMTSGFQGGPAPPGSPPSGFFRNATVTGGTGAYLGARGMMISPLGTSRIASMQEDPINRRTNGGGQGHFIVYLIPMSWPQIATTTSGPAVFHADFSPVTAAKPARAGEILILTATGLGPTNPAMDPGKSFPSDPLAVVNSPVEATVNGNAADVINKIGWPGTTDRYRLDIRVPNGTAPGMATLQMTAAFIPAQEVSIPVQ